MRVMITLAFLVLFPVVFSQNRSKDKFELEISRLMTAKRQYEKFEGYALKNPDRYKQLKNSSYHSYIGYIKKLKSNSKEFKNYINNAIKNTDLDRELLMYSYVNKDLPFDPYHYMISKLDLYRVINYYLFEKDKNVLPKKLENIEISLKRNNHKSIKLQNEQDIFQDILKNKN